MNQYKTLECIFKQKYNQKQSPSKTPFRIINNRTEKSL